MEGALRPLCPPPPDLAITGPTSFSIRGGPNPCPLHQSVRPKHHQSDPRKQTPGGRHQIGIPAGFKSESAADFRLECVAGFVGIRTLFRQGCLLYELIPNMPEQRLRSLIEGYKELFSQNSLFTQPVGLV